MPMLVWCCLLAKINTMWGNRTVVQALWGKCFVGCYLIFHIWEHCVRSGLWWEFFLYWDVISNLLLKDYSPEPHPEDCYGDLFFNPMFIMIHVTGNNSYFSFKKFTLNINIGMSPTLSPNVSPAPSRSNSFNLPSPTGKTNVAYLLHSYIDVIDHHIKRNIWIICKQSCPEIISDKYLQMGESGWYNRNHLEVKYVLIRFYFPYWIVLSILGSLWAFLFTPDCLGNWSRIS